MLQIGFKPAQDLLEAALPVQGLARPGQFVVFALEEHHFAGDTVVLQGREHLKSLGEGTVVVLQGMDKQGGCFNIGGILEGSMVPHPVQSVPGGGGEFLCIEGVADAGVAKVTDGVAEGALGTRGARVVLR